MKTNILFLLVCIVLSMQAYGQDYNCPVTASYMKAQKQKGGTALSKTTASTAAITGPQDLVVLFVDYPEGRKQPGNILPTTDADTMYFHNKGNDSVFDAIGSLGWVWIDPNNHNLGLRRNIRKYTYDNYWDMFFSVGTYYSNHPDSVSHNILAYGSMRDYYKEVSYNLMDINPYQTHSGVNNKYHTGIVNAIDSVNGKKYIRWIMMPKSKSSYTYDGDIKTPLDTADINPVIRAAYSRGETTLNIDTYQGKIIIVGAGSCSGGITTLGGKYISVREKRYNNYDNRSTLDGIWVSVHEYGHTLQFAHLASSTYDPMNVTLRNEWTRHLYCPPHFNPIYKLQAGWISPSSVIKIKNNGSVSLPPVNTSPTVASFAVYGDPLKSEYFIAE
jgi:M6 family metalloprotease-like protein